MPKLKTKSSVKKRFSLTATGKVRRNQAMKQHGMRKRSQRSLQVQSGTTILAKCDEALVKPHMPYAK